MIATTLRGLLARKRRLLATTTAVVLGVAFLVATLTVGDTMRAGFAQGFADAYAGVDVTVRSSVTVGSEPKVRDVVDADVIASLAELDGVAAVVPVVEGVGTIVGADGNRIGGNGPPTVGTNWIEDLSVNPYRIVDGRPPSGPGEVVIDRNSATTGDLAVGDQTTVLIPEPIEVTVVGIATFGDQDSFGPLTMTAFDAVTADDLFAVRPGAATQVLVVAEDGVSDVTLRDEITAALPDRLEALTRAETIADEEAAIESDFVGLFERMLLTFAVIALVVATFSIYNTFSIVVAQRTRESALLRALGASRRQVITGVTIEALIIGVAAAAIGIGAGVLLALGLQRLVAGLGFDLGSGTVITTGTLVAGALVGIVTTLLASVAPAITASRVAPLAALRDVAIDRSGTSIRRAIIGAVITVAGLIMVVTATSSPERAVIQSGVGTLVVIIGAVVLGPVAARPASFVLGGIIARTRGVTGTLARRNAMRNPRRVAGSAAALMVGTAVVSLFATFGSSIKESIDQEVGRAFSGDLVVLQTDFSGAGISPEARPAIAALPEVDSVVGVSFVAAQVDGAEFNPVATDPAALAHAFDLGVVDGDLAAMGAGQVAISTDYAGDRNLTVGDSLTVEFVDGPMELTVAAVYEEALSFGDVVITNADWEPRARGLGEGVLFVNLADGTSVTDGQDAVATVTSGYGAPDPQTRDEYIDATGAQVDQMMAVVYGLLAVAVLIALLGIANTLSLSIHERTRELGLLRAVGQTRRQVRATVRWESVIVAVFGTIGGVGLGTFLGWGLMRALRAQEGLGAFAAPINVLVVVLVLAVVAGVLAAVRPARRAARLDVLSAISAD